jgi:hypothetical protein
MKKLADCVTVRQLRSDMEALRAPLLIQHFSMSEMRNCVSLTQEESAVRLCSYWVLAKTRVAIFIFPDFTMGLTRRYFAARWWAGGDVRIRSARSFKSRGLQLSRLSNSFALL